VAGLRLRPEQDEDQVGVDAVGDEHLGAADDVGITVAAGDGLDMGDVRATRWLRHAECDDLLALDGWRQPTLALRVVPEFIDRRRGDRDVSADARRDSPRTAAGELLAQDRFIDDPVVPSSIFLRILQAQKVQRTDSLEQVAWKLLCFFPLVDVRTDLLVDEAADGASELLVLRPS